MPEVNQTNPVPRPPEITDETPIGPDIDLDSEEILLPSGTRLTNEMIPALVDEIRAATGGTAEWPGIEDAAGLLNVRIAGWNDFGYATPPAPHCKPIPPLGERSADAIKAGHGAIEVIDEITRELGVLRGQLVGELRANEDALMVRVDATLAEARARRDKTACAKCHAEPCKDGSPFGARCLDICHEALEFDHCCMICATPEEARALGFRVIPDVTR